MKKNKDNFEEDLTTLRLKRCQNNKEKNDEIRTLKNELFEIQKNTEENIENFLKKTDKDISGHIQSQKQVVTNPQL